MIVHFTTVHPRDDSRIRSKQVNTLARELKDEVVLFVQDGLGDEVDKDFGYRVIDTGPRLGRLRRATVGAWRMISAVRQMKPTVAHFHDPELLPWALLLRLSGIKVVYDVHEDVPQQISRHPSLPLWAKHLLPPVVSLVEWVGAKFINGVVTVTPTIAARFPAHKTVLVRNFPLLDELHEPDATPMSERPKEFTYIGSISEDRNIYSMIEAVARVPGGPAVLRLAGEFAAPETQQRAQQMPEWNSVKFDGWVSREGVAGILADGRAGLVVLKPVPHEMLTLPIKLFEYMAAGMPVISSDFPLWREIVEGAGCGVLVDPTKTDELVQAMQWILDNPQEAQAMGERGRSAVVERYNWNLEALSLLELYRRI
ncbi:glycosyltransferase family 4 protein [Devosia rhodophyticola]|uniref:Glycosyltransferase family 4 protein n=1 Tax=Devosia rhodophyticola TaxID=3026423 RepID=A0ABY7Z0V3_9HYPH|nr:glycosyltransferase family 4 protein [Devosia rhodophyticola]WDR07283.1 glycosyltransferase family 4 protein [Devosia rhodophyticola]